MQCVCCTSKDKVCQNPSNKLVGKLPGSIRNRVCKILKDNNAMKRCSKSKECYICSTHLKVALRVLLNAPASVTIVTLLETALCSFSGWSSIECEEFFTANDVHRYDI